MVSDFPSAVAVYGLTPMPLFLIMGSLFLRTGLGENVFKALDMCIGNLRARLSYLVVLAGAVFAALSGSSLSNTATMALTMPAVARTTQPKTTAATVDVGVTTDPATHKR